MRGDTPGHFGTVAVATDDMRPQPGDILTVIEDADEVAQITSELGHPSTVALTLDRSAMDHRRITVSARAVEGCSSGIVAARAPVRRNRDARVRRGDIDVLATDDLVLAPGDPVRVVAPRDALTQVAALLEDPERGVGDLNALGLGLGLALGLLAGSLVFPLPGGGTFALGNAARPAPGRAAARAGDADRAGAVVAAAPRVQRPVPARDAHVPRVGRLERRVRARERARHRRRPAATGPRRCHHRDRRGRDPAARAASGEAVRPDPGRDARLRFYTQPAVLAHANEATGGDPRVNLGYALVYPAAMIVKVVLAPFIGTWG